MPKRKSKSKHKNGLPTQRDSMLLLTPAVEEGALNHKMAGANGHAYYGPDSSEYYPTAAGGASASASPNDEAAQDWDAQEEAFEPRGVGLDFAILDSTFLLSQVFPTLFMGMIVQFAQSVTAYIACSAFFGAVAIYLANQIVFDQKDLKS